jgi:hypothetical protein
MKNNIGNLTTPARDYKKFIKSIHENEPSERSRGLPKISLID